MPSGPPSFGRITNGFDFLDLHSRRIITKGVSDVSQDIGELLVVQPHGGHRDESVFLALNLGGAG